MISLIAAALIVGGTLLMLVAAIGVARMPDLYIRLQASTKAASLGAGSVLLALALMFGDFAVAMRAMLAITFIFLTVPISGHMIARAAYLVGVPPWDQTRWDELKGKYDRVTHVAASPDLAKPAAAGSVASGAVPVASLWAAGPAGPAGAEHSTAAELPAGTEPSTGARSGPARAEVVPPEAIPAEALGIVAEDDEQDGPDEREGPARPDGPDGTSR
jgi:multicomponent Na+:H+ antiporter subunit G